MKNATIRECFIEFIWRVDLDKIKANKKNKTTLDWFKEKQKEIIQIRGIPKEKITIKI